MALASVFYFICFLSAAGMLAHAFGFINFRHGEKVVLGVLVVISAYAAVCFRCFTVAGAERRQRLIRRQLFFIFLFYIVMLIDFTLIDDSLGRNIFNVFSWNRELFVKYIEEKTNIIPFETVKLFINALKNGYLPPAAVAENIFGNIAAFMPLPFFAVCLFKHFDKWYSVLWVVLLSVLLIELLQFLFLTGASDIDDVILNVSGAMIFYALLKNKTVGRIISKVTFGVWETGENKG